MINFYNRRTVEKKMKESIRKDRARIQVGKISNFGLLEMTRQRLRQGSINWETVLSLDSFAQKIIKKIEMLAFSNKTKIIMAFVPEKVSVYLNLQLKKELSFFEKKYKFKINIQPDSNLIIPEYKIHLLNKNKKIIDKIEHAKSIFIESENNKINPGRKNSVLKNKKTKESLGKILWVRRKRRNKSN